MSRALYLLLLLASVTIAKGQDNFDHGDDTKIIRVQPLSEEQKRQPTPEEKTRSIYLVNVLPVPGRNQNDNGLSETSRGRNPTLFLLQKVQDNNAPLPDGIYYKPADPQNGTPPPIQQKDLTDLQAYILGRATVKHPGRQ